MAFDLPEPVLPIISQCGLTRGSTRVASARVSVRICSIGSISSSPGGGASSAFIVPALMRSMSFIAALATWACGWLSGAWWLVCHQRSSSG